jgi:hypothetical protein
MHRAMSVEALHGGDLCRLSAPAHGCMLHDPDHDMET